METDERDSLDTVICRFVLAVVFPLLLEISVFVKVCALSSTNISYQLLFPSNKKYVHTKSFNPNKFNNVCLIVSGLLIVLYIYIVM